MRIKIKMEGEGGGILLPVHYNHLIQSFIYKNLHQNISTWLHATGYQFGKRKYKMFVFSRLFAREIEHIEEGKIFFKNPVYFKIGSLKEEILESIAIKLIQKTEFKLYGQKCRFISIEVEMPVEGRGEALYKAISPITVYSTLKGVKGKRKTYFYTPWEEEFAEKIKENLIRKAVALYGKAPETDWQKFKFEPYKVSTKKNFVLAKYKGTIIKGWTGIYKIQIPSPYFEIAYNAGVGSKNSQGFGMLDLWKKGELK